MFQVITITVNVHCDVTFCCFCIYCFNPPLTVSAQLLYIIPRLLPETRGAAGCSAGAHEEKENPTDLWADTTNSSSTWRKTALQLWRLPAFWRRGDTPQYQVAQPPPASEQENTEQFATQESITSFST